MKDILVTPEVSHAPMSSLKDDAPELHPIDHIVDPLAAQNKYDMSVTLAVSHVEMCPYCDSADGLPPENQ